MITTTYAETAVFEHRFWLQILGDHARFMYHGLSPRESVEIKRAESFIHSFDKLLLQARDPIASTGLETLNRDAHELTKELRDYKLHLLKKKLRGDVTIEVSPTFFNHMVNELEEYLRILAALGNLEIPVCPPVHHHLLWLLDASGHASIIGSKLDTTEKLLLAKGAQFQHHFEAFYLKAVELAGYMRTHLEQFPALRRFNHDVELEMYLFMTFLHELKELQIHRKLLGTLTVLMPDHMAREECYYLTKLAEVSDIERPDCDPARPRMED